MLLKKERAFDVFQQKTPQQQAVPLYIFIKKTLIEINVNFS